MRGCQLPDREDLAAAQQLAVRLRVETGATDAFEAAGGGHHMGHRPVTPSAVEVSGASEYFRAAAARAAAARNAHASFAVDWTDAITAGPSWQQAGRAAGLRFRRKLVLATDFDRAFLRGFFTIDAEHPSANSRPHWSTKTGGHLYYEQNLVHPGAFSLTAAHAASELPCLACLACLACRAAP